MAYTSTNNGHQSPQSSLPPLSVKVVNTGTWGGVANTCLITDEYIHPNSIVLAWVTGTTPAAGRWSTTVSQGTATITSTDAENSTLPVSYIIL
jgi:hypothetical protein